MLKDFSCLVAFFYETVIALDYTQNSDEKANEIRLL
jgi:hypothetical protein